MIDKLTQSLRYGVFFRAFVLMDWLGGQKISSRERAAVKSRTPCLV